MSKKLYGLLGKNISYSFSKKYFTQKFITQSLAYKYENFDIESIDELPELLDRKVPKLKGFNVTVPYKELIIPILDDLDSVAKKIGAVNCVKIEDSYYLKGYNTDAYGFENSLKPVLKSHHKKALVLGTGGASKAIIYVLNKLKIDFVIVSRNPNEHQISYESLDEDIIKNHQLIINTTPLGTLGKLENECPAIPYQCLNDTHLLYDLTYNPSETLFLKKGKEKGAVTINGLKMLELQAEKSWEIWSKS